MRTKTQTMAICLCGCIALTQLFSCKKEDSTLNQPLTSENVSDAIVDSTADSTLLRGLVAWYTFNGDVLDHSGNNNNVVYNSAAPAKGKGGLAKTAFAFDGVSSYMQVNNSSTINPLKITLYALVKPTGFYQGKCHGNRILSKGYNDYDKGRYLLGYDDNAYWNYQGCDAPVQNDRENFYGSYGDGSVASGAVYLNKYIKLSSWYSIVYTFDGVYSKLYVNGNLLAKVAKSTSFNANSNPLFIGRNQDPLYPYYFKGLIDEMRIYKRVLNASEVAELSK
jgi:hypothetical protein